MVFPPLPEGCMAVWVSYPLKQGLKLYILSRFFCFLWSLSQLSIKTRIETRMPENHYMIPRDSLSQLSIKTRIETKLKSKQWWNEVCLSQLSIKTRIETKVVNLSCLIRFVWVSYPLKQGLKPGCDQGPGGRKSGLSQLSIKTRIETKGLPIQAGIMDCLSQLSIKTRIETPNGVSTWASSRTFESAIH